MSVRYRRSGRVLVTALAFSAVHWACSKGGTSTNRQATGASGAVSQAPLTDCVPETEGQFCARRGKTCKFSGIDNCGRARVADCGTCTAPEKCSTGGPMAGTCTTACDYESDAQFCACIGHSCGANTLRDKGGKTHPVYCGQCERSDYCSGFGHPYGGLTGVCSTGGGLGDLQKRKAQVLTSIWDKGIPKIDYLDAQDLKDGRGYTSGRSGFCTGTGDAILVVQCYADVKPGNVMQKYVPALVAINERFVASGGIELQGSTAELASSGSWASDWKSAAGDDAFNACQDAIDDAAYYGQAMTHAITHKFSTALTKAALYDAQVNQGETDPRFGIQHMITLADTETGTLSDPPTREDESRWLATFLRIRAEILQRDPGYRSTVHRAANYEKLRRAGNWDLDGCILTNAKASTYWGNEFSSISSRVYKIVTDPKNQEQPSVTAGGSCP